MSNSDFPYATPRAISGVDECSFYHTMEIPGIGTVEGLWDLRGAEELFLGRVDLAGKRVLEIGPASGALSFFMEQKGAEVVALDLDEHQDWDVVPYAGVDYQGWQRERRSRLTSLNNGFWLAHRAHDSRTRVLYGSVYAIPPEVGRFDIALLSCVLLHLRDPFLALQKTAALVDDTVIITETFYPHFMLNFFSEAAMRIGIHLPVSAFIPRTQRPEMGTWWGLTPEVIRRFLEVLGFSDQRTIYHYRARHQGRRQLMYTIVGRRTTQAET